VLEGVLQFAYVAGPFILLKELENLVHNASWIYSRPPRMLEQVSSKKRNIFAALAQRCYNQ
jgi:hypothetical protein